MGIQSTRIHKWITAKLNRKYILELTEIEGKLEKKENGKVYLKQGTYTVELKLDGSTVKEMFTVEPANKRPERRPVEKTP